MEILENVILDKYSTFRSGGPARYFCVAKTEADLRSAVMFAKKKKLEIFILGGGSNVLISDNGFHGLVIKIELMGLEFVDSEKGGTEVVVGAGENWDSLVSVTIQKNLYGLENLSLIPGTVGASAVQNIGAYGAEAKDTISWVKIYNPEKDAFEILQKKDCAFGYRTSVFKKETDRNWIITKVAFLLKKEGKLKTDYKDVTEYLKSQKIEGPKIADVRRAVVEIRTKKLPDISKVGTAGSFFKNVIVSKAELEKLKEKFPEIQSSYFSAGEIKISLAWVLDKVCGFNGVRIGDAGVHERQPLVLVNFGDKSSDVKKLADEMALCVKQKTGLSISPEVVFVGKF